MSFKKDVYNENLVQCRACLKNDGSVDMFTQSGIYSYSDMMLVCTAVFVRKEDVAKSKYICGPCLERLKDAFEFRTLCQRSERHLNKTRILKSDDSSMHIETDLLVYRMKTDDEVSWDGPQPLEYVVDAAENLDEDTEENISFVLEENISFVLEESPSSEFHQYLKYMEQGTDQKDCGVTILQVSEMSENEEEPEVLSIKGIGGQYKQTKSKCWTGKKAPTKQENNKKALKESHMNGTNKMDDLQTDCLKKELSENEKESREMLLCVQINKQENDFIEEIEHNIPNRTVKEKKFAASIETAKPKSLVMSVPADGTTNPYKEYTVRFKGVALPEGATGVEYKVIDVVEYPELDEKFSRSQLLQLIKSGTLGRKMDKVGAISEFTMNLEEDDGDERLFVVRKILEHGEALSQIVRFIFLHWEDAITPVVKKLLYMKKFYKYSVGAGSRNKLLKTHRVATVQGKSVIRNRISHGQRKRCHNKSQLCEICGKTSTYMNKHMRSHTGERPYTCSMCPATFVGHSDAQIHLAKHLGIPNRHKCGQCDRAFYTKCRLKQHMEAHSQERPVACHICGKTFKSVRYIKFHQRIHQIDKQFICDYCDRIFLHRQNIYKHIQRNHMGNVRVPCPHCHRLILPQCMQRHISRKHADQHTAEPATKPDKKKLKIIELEPETLKNNYHCQICGEEFTAQAQLLKHVTCVHA